MEKQDAHQLPSPKVLLPLGLVLVLAAVAAFVFLNVHVVSGAFAAVLGLAGVAMAVQSVIRFKNGER